MTRILASASPGEIRIALIEGRLTGYAIWRPGAPDGLGDVHLGRLIARVPAMAGAFVMLEGGAEGFLPDSAGAAGKTEGDMLVVRITRSPQGGKGPRLAADPHEAPRTRTPALLRAGPTPLERLAAAHPEAGIDIDDPALLARLRPAFGDRLHLVPQSFGDDLEAETEALAEPAIDLPGFMHATITPTPALVAIDIDGGATTAARDAKPAAQFAANRAALPELARQIRLRQLSGAILIDFAGLPARRREKLGPDLITLLAQDPAVPRLLGFTALGLAEILRPRHHPPLHELLHGPHAAGLQALRKAASQPTQRLVLRAHPAIIAALQADTAALASLARRVNHPLLLRSDPTLGPCRWILDDA